MAKLTVADLEVLFTANTDQVEKADKQIVAIGKKVESNPVKVTADAKGALGSMERVEGAAKKLVSERAVVKLDADISRAEKNLARAVDRLEDLHVRAEGGLDVTADVKRAESSILRIERQLDGLKRARNVVDVEVDDAPAESGLKRFLSKFKRRTEDAGEEGGRSLGKGLDAATRGAGEKVGEVVGGDVQDTLIKALEAIPVAGGLILAGVAIGKAVTGAIQDGLNAEKSVDRLQALTGVDEADARRIARAAGEAYANNFGESIESNMDTSRLALQFGILDADATTRDAQKVVQGLSGIADALEEDVRPVAQSVTTLLSTGVAGSAEEAYDLLAAGARNGLNRNEDLVDTLTEYPALFKRLGLSGSDALGLINQGMKAGARNSDLAADALKEFQIRATDASESSATGFEQLGLNAEEMTRKIARGGDDAREGLDTVLRKLRETEDPVLRNAAAVALFGTQAEDLGDALFAMDLSTAVEQLDGVQGSAQRMFDTLRDNDASKIEQAQRNIEVAADGIKGALAAAFSEPLGDVADWVSQNRGPMTQFMLDLANGAIEFGRGLVNGAADGTEAFGQFVAGPLADIIEGFKHIVKLMNPWADTSDLEDFIDGMREFDDTTAGVADTMRDTLLPKLDDAQNRLNEWGKPVVALGFVNDAALRTASAIDAVGETADGSAASAELLAEQVERSVQALKDELTAAQDAGESQQNLTDRYNATTQALVDQLVATGMEEQAAWDLIGAYGAVPDLVQTTIDAKTDEAQAKVDEFVNQDRTLSVRVIADGAAFEIGGRTVTAQGKGSVLSFMANGGLTPMSPVAQNVPPNTWRVVGDRSDVSEAYIPLDGSARSMSILFEAMRRMGVMPMADGAIASSASAPGGGSFQFGDIVVNGSNLDALELTLVIQRAVRDELNSTFTKGGL